MKRGASKVPSICTSSTVSILIHRLKVYLNIFRRGGLNHIYSWWLLVVMETLRPFIENGQVEYLGLSDCGIDELRRAKAVPLVGEKVVAVQVEFSPFDLESETSEFVSGARELGVTIIPYSPLGRGELICHGHVMF
jgi:aryl-alcohol dehydrogenase-like predicted oxidoreductase